MISFLWIYSSLLLGSPTWAAPSASCGVFEVRGVVRRDGATARLISGERSQSETVFTVRTPESYKLLSYEDIAVRAEVLLNHPLDGTRGLADEVMAVEMRVPDPLFSGQDSFYRLKEARACRPRAK